jgi:peroxiredoxin
MSPIALNDAAPDFALAGIDGGRHTLESYADADVLVLIQSCNHCPYVLAWEGRMKEVQRDYADRGVRVVAFNSNDASRYPMDSYEGMVKHAAEEEFNFDYLHDEDQSLAAALGSERTPEVFLFDRDRKLRYHGAIDDNRDGRDVHETYLRDALDAVLEQRDPAVSETAPTGCSVKWLQ